ncbi:MAG: sigma 54-interacting transcriptional regulator [Herbinix sp.]|nr:sigma 54-interacting transcriptional regulator [Herbinix sp.]
MSKTKQSILEYIFENTKNLVARPVQVNVQFCTTNEIVKELHISRNLASQYLNELEKEKWLIKLHSRPVCFLYRETIVKRLGELFDIEEEYNTKELLALLQTGYTEQCFSKMIGYDTSLSYCIEQCKSAMKYPECGLPILMSGEEGTGKTLLATFLYEYGINEGVIPASGNFHILECDEIERATDAGIKVIFGQHLMQNGKKIVKPGMLEIAENGVLLIKNVNALSEKCQEKLAEFLETRVYKRTNNNAEKQTSNVRLIFEASEHAKENIKKSLLSQIPVICELPTMQKRSLEDKEKLIMKFFQEEELKLMREIQISCQVYQVLMDYSFPENITQMKNCIKVACASAFIKQENDKKLVVLLYHLPESILVESDVSLNQENTQLIDVGCYQKKAITKKIIQYFEYVLDEYWQFHELKLPFKEFVNHSTEYMNQYYDYIIYERQYDNRKVKAMEAIVQKVFGIISDKYDIFFPTQCGYVLARNVYMLLDVNSQITKWEQENSELIANCLDSMTAEYMLEMRMSLEIRELLEVSLNARLNSMSLVFLTLNIRFYNKRIQQDKVSAMVMTMGYLTAGAMADTVNRILGKHIFESMAITGNSTAREVVAKVSERMKSEYFSKKMILMTDTEYGEGIAKEISERFQMEVGFTNQVSTEALLEAGRKIIEGCSISKILEAISEKMVYRCEIYSSSQKEPTILFVSELGEVINNRVIKMFEDSILKTKRIKCVSLDTSMIIGSGKEGILKKYEVLFILGTWNPKFDKIPFIPLEDIITFNNLGNMNRVLNNYFTPEEIQEFNENLVKNFTLQNVVAQLTILNADILLGYIKKALNYLQQELACIFSVQTTIGISIHISCLVERLVTKSEIEVNENMAAFIRENSSFIHSLQKAFGELTEHYHIEIPNSEIMYIYDYITNDKKNTLEEF